MAARHAGPAHGYPALYRPLAGFIVATAAFAAIFVALTLSAYHAPRPHGLPVGIVGPTAATSRVEHALDSASPGAFSWRSYSSAAGARTGIAQREVDGALVASGPTLRLFVAEGGGTAPAQALTQAFGVVAAKTGRPLVVTDVVPPLPGDTQALSSFFVLLSVLIPTLAAGSGSALAFRRARPALAVGVPLAVAIAVGLVSAAVADGIAGLGNYAAIAGVVALFCLAVAAPTALLARIWPPLVLVAVLVFIVFGIPVSGGPANLASFSPAFLRALDPALPLGVAANVVRNVVYFGGHAIALRLWVLAAWALAGVAGLILVTTLRRPAPAQTEAVPPLVPAESEPALTHSASASAASGLGGTQPLNLIVGFDNSEPARRALIWSANLLKSRTGTLHVVYADHVVIDSDLSGVAHAEMEEARNQKAVGVGGAAAEIANAAGVPYTFERRQDSPADAILSAAEIQDAADSASTPVIVTGRSHHAAHRIIGSVPVELLHQSPYPVLTISLPGHPGLLALVRGLQVQVGPFVGDVLDAGGGRVQKPSGQVRQRASGGNLLADQRYLLVGGTTARVAAAG
jgi:nucleotide-binding universal stress UspA family protein